MPFIFLHHVGHEFADEREVADDVDLEELLGELI